MNKERAAETGLPLTPEERNRVLIEWNRTKVEYPKESCLHDLFESQAARTPDSIAVLFGEMSLSYGELNRRANHLARQLRAAGVSPDSIVGLCVERSFDLVIGVLGILKAGGAYLPLDIAYPRDRLAFMLEDTRAPVLLTQRALVAQLPPHRAKLICLDEVAAEGPAENPISGAKPNHLAYVIYTSGSTGKPKGVLLEHRSAVNLITSILRDPGFTEQDVMLSVTTLSFDIATAELFLPLCSGGKLVVASRKVATDGAKLLALLNSCKATFLQPTPVTWQMLLDAGWPGSPQLKMICTGEPLPRELAARLLPKGASLWNLYGPTETTIWSTGCQVTSSDVPISIGKPLANTQTYILDPHLQPVPVGTPGELYLGGDGLARGYLNRPELTAEKFVPNPFVAVDGSARLYRTGDLARWWPDGTIECLGRIDHQVKLRGFRIELGEIEAVLDSHPAVSKSTVIARDDMRGEKRLVAYYIAATGKRTNIDELRRFLKDRLPDHMVPSVFVVLPEFPMTPNRKIDRKALPEPDLKRPDLGCEYVAPLTETEKEVCRIWSDTLEVERIGIHDNFFDLGGHSLVVLRTISLINDRFKSDLPPVALFECPTVASLCALLESQRPNQAAVSALENPKSVPPPEASKADLAVLASIVAQRRDPLARAASKRQYRMRESRICRWILAPSYRIGSERVRSLVQYLILKLEGGELFTVTLRKLYAKYHEIQIGDYSEQCFDVNRMQRKTKIGRYTGIYPTVVIQTADHPRNTISTNALFYHPALKFAEGYALPRVELQIGNDVFIGHNAMILYPTKRIGDGAVIAAGSVVVEDVPPYAIVGGYPARVLRYRFSRHMIEELLKSRWWEASLEELEPVKGNFARPLEGDTIR